MTAKFPKFLSFQSISQYSRRRLRKKNLGNEKDLKNKMSKKVNSAGVYVRPVWSAYHMQYNVICSLEEQ